MDRHRTNTSGRSPEVYSRVGRRANATSGQALLEACLALALLSFVWVLVMFSSYMVNNWIRTAMAARHAVWLKANGGNASTEAISDDFFFVDGGDVIGVKIEGGKGSILGMISGDDANYGGMGDAHWAEVKFGMSATAMASTDKFPFNLMNSQLPFMPPSALVDFYEVKSHCQWDDVCKTWDSWQDALQGVWNTIRNVVGDVAGELFGALF